MNDNLSIFNVHLSKDNCTYCHFDNLSINYDEEICLKCHNSRTLSVHTHASNFKYLENDLVKIDNEFPLRDGKVVCITCHVFNQKNCENFDIRSFKMLRNFTNSVNFCFNCHKVENFKKFNPHYQIDIEGNINYSTCTVCHIATPKIDYDYNAAIKTLKGDPDKVCNGCHQIKGVHPTGTDHISKYVSGFSKYFIEKKYKEKNINFYLGENDKLICVTCHYPHNFEEKSLNQLKNKRRVRSNLDSYDICLLCHLK
ncbi:MAG: hypothetical protein LDL13_07340 [Calditerrivibrio sp.]|nr:hypothetical protein [Calditerrivibrio sp.]